jgi:hypothetical protein
MTSARRRLLLFLSVAISVGCGIRDVHLDPDALGSGGTESGGADEGGTAGAPTDVGVAGRTGGTPSVAGHAGIAGMGLAGVAGHAGTNTVPIRTKSVFVSVVAGTVLTSPKYSMILTVGEAPGGNQTMQSTNYRLHRGFVGVSQ